MERQQIQNFIKECRPYMISQLQKEIVYFLKENEILTEDEFNDIVQFKSREHQVVMVLDILPTKQSHHLNCFIQYLSDWYSWIIHYFKRKSQIVDYAVQEKEKMLDLGGVPPMPSRYVQRREEYANLCKYLHELKRNQYIIVHGMRGCGKSTLVVDVLRHSYTLALDDFKQKVFWLTVGRESCVDELTIQQELCSKIMFNRGYGVHSVPLESKIAKQFLIEKLTNPELEDCLLILDDVSSSDIIQALDVGCRILVTTDDTASMIQTKKKAHFIRVSDGFTEDETLRLFSQCIDSEKEKLPKQAKLIYSICKGFPLTISLIGSQLEEHKKDVQNNMSRWDFYVSKLNEKNIDGAFGFCDLAKREQVTSLYKAIGMSIDSLESNLKDLYQDFALFMDDVNIKAEVLCTLWELDETPVHDIMREFERKCLVVRAWNHVRNCYIYCVHDLLLNYLKHQISTSQKEALHLKLIQKYQKRFGDDIIDFPTTDNYIFLYLGHHLKEANLLDYFPQLYLNLRFIEKKIMNFGAADLLLDLRKYQKFIAHDAVSKKQYEDVLHFVKHVGACKSISNSDIVQFGLCEHKSSYVFETATSMAKNEKYFEILTDISKEKSAPTVHYGREEIVTATFVSDVNVIVANPFGAIKLINIPHNQTLISFRGHEKKVTQLQLTKNLIYFLSASEDCTIRIWYLNDYSSLEKNYSEKARTPSPQLRQSDWQDLWPNQRLSGEAAVAILDQHRLPVKQAKFSNTGTLIASISDDLQTILWKLTLERKDLSFVISVCGHEVIESKEQFESVAFSNDDETILCATREGRVVRYQSNNGALVSAVEIGCEIVSISVIPGIPQVACVVLHKDLFKVWQLDALPEDSDRTQLLYQTAGRKREDNFICSAISWDGAYIAIATKNHNILIYELSSGDKISKFTESSGKIRSLSWSKQNTALLTTYGTELLKIWHFSKNGLRNCASKLCQSIFDAQWIWDLEEEESCNDRPLVTAALDKNSQIRVFYDLQEKVILSSPTAKIVQCCVGPFDGNIIYACEDGSVHLVILDSWNTRQIMKVSCQKLLKLKVFAHGDRLLAIVSAEMGPGKTSLVGCLKRAENEFSFDTITYERNAEVIYEFSADLKSDSVYVIDNNSILKIYSCRTAQEKLKESADPTDCLKKIKFCDISANFTHVVTGDEYLGLIRPVLPDVETKFLAFEKEVKVFRFNHDGSMLAVGFADGSFHINETECFSKLHSAAPLKFASEVIDFTWGIDGNRLIVIFDREIILYSIRDKLSLESILFMSVDKVVCNQSMKKCVTIDSEGQFQVIKFPSI